MISLLKSAADADFVTKPIKKSKAKRYLKFFKNIDAISFYKKITF